MFVKEKVKTNTENTKIWGTCKLYSPIIHKMNQDHGRQQSKLSIHSYAGVLKCRFSCSFLFPKLWRNMLNMNYFVENGHHIDETPTFAQNLKSKWPNVVTWMPVFAFSASGWEKKVEASVQEPQVCQYKGYSAGAHGGGSPARSYWCWYCHPLWQCGPVRQWPPWPALLHIPHGRLWQAGNGETMCVVDHHCWGHHGGCVCCDLELWRTNTKRNSESDISRCKEITQFSTDSLLTFLFWGIFHLLHLCFMW